MRFLVFNIVVMLSLGYLLTGQKDQSVGNWLDALPGKITTSYETGDLTALLADDEHSKGALQPSPLAAPIQPQKAPIKPQQLAEPEVTADALRELVEQTVRKSVTRRMKQLNEVAETTALADNSQPAEKIAQPVNSGQSAAMTEQPSNSVEAALPVEADIALQQPSIASDDADLAQALSEFSKTPDIGTMQEGRNSEAEAAGAMASDASPDKPAFMTPQERRLALSDFIQQVQLVSLERGGF